MAFIHDRNSPDRQAAKDTSSNSLIKTIGTMAMSMIGYGIGVKVLKSVSFRANVGVGKLISKLTVPDSAVNRTIQAAKKTISMTARPERIRRAARGSAFLRRLRFSARRAINRIDRDLKGSLGRGITEGRYSPHAVKKTITRAERDLGQDRLIGRTNRHLYTKAGTLKDIRATSIVSNTEWFRNSSIGKTINKLRADADYANANVSTGIGTVLRLLRGKGAHGLNVGRAIRGKAYSYATYLGSFAAADYAMYNITMPSQKKWYDPRKVAEWGLFTVGSDLAFRGAIPNIKAISQLGTRAVGKLIKQDDMGANFMKTLLRGAHKMARSTTVRSLHEAGDKLVGTKARRSSSLSEFSSRVRHFSKEFNAAKLRLSKQKRKLSSPDAYDQAMEHLRNIDSSLGDGAKEATRTNVLRNIGRATAANDPNKWLGTVNKIFGTNLQSTKRAISIEGKSQMIYKGQGFVSSSGENYDIARIMPTKILGKAFSFAHDNFKILGFPVFSVMGIKPHIDAKANKYSLYSLKNSDGFIDVGIGYDMNAIERKLSTIKSQQQSKINQILVSESKEIKDASDILKEIETGKLGTVEDRTIMRQLRREQTDLEAAREFVDDFTAHRTQARSKKDVEDLKRGYVRLKKNEHIHFVGDRAYYGVKEGGQNGKFKIHQLGYDVNKGAYHRLTHLREDHAGGMISLMQTLRGYGNTKTPKDRPVKAYSRSRVNPNSGPMSKLFWGMADSLEIGNKSQRSILGIASDYITKLYHPKTFRNMRSLLESNPNLMHRLENAGESITALSRMKTITREMDTAITSNVINKSDVIDSMVDYTQRFAAKTGRTPHVLEDVMENFKNGNMFIRENVDIGVDEFNTQIRNNAKNLIKSVKKVGRSQVTDIFQDEVRMSSHRDIQFLNKLINEKNPLEFLGRQSHGGVKNKDMYNNSVFRTFFNSIDNARQDDLLITLKNSTSSQSLRRNIDMLNMSSMINVYDNLNPARLDEAQRIILGKATAGNITRNPSAADRIADIIESPFKPSKLHDNIGYPDTSYRPANIALSQNKSIEGEALYSAGEQILGSFKTVAGEKLQTPQTTASMLTAQTMNAINNTGTLLGVGFHQDAVSSVGEFGKRVLFKRILPAMALGTAYQAADAFLDESSIFDGTILGEGLSVLGANMIAQSRAAIAGVNDAIGLTAMSKYLEDIMPGFVNSPLAHGIRGIGSPLAGVGLGMKMGGPKGGLIGGSIGAAISLFTSGGPLGVMGKFDITKSREQLIEEYSGRRQVPHYKGAGWFFSLSPIAGQKIDRFEPSWFHKMQSQYKYTDVLYGGKCFHPDALIQTTAGYKKVKDIQINDKTYDGSGNITTIIDKFKQPKDNRPILWFDIHSMPKEINNMKITHDHRVLALKTMPCKKRQKTASGSKNSCLPNRYAADGRCDTCISNLYKEYIPSLVEARYINKGDYLLDAIPQYPNNNVFSFKIQIQGKEHTKELSKTQDLYYLIGYYLAEGNLKYSNRKSGRIATSLEFTHHDKEAWMSTPIYRLCKEMHINCKQDKRDGKTTVLQIHNTELAQCIESICGSKADNKFIHYDIKCTNIDNTNALLCGYLNGDGNIDNDRICATTVSYSLALDIRELMLRNDIMMSVSMRKGRLVKFQLENGYTTTSIAKDSYEIKIFGNVNIRKCVDIIFHGGNQKFSQIHASKRNVNRMNYFFFTYDNIKYIALKVDEISEYSYSEDVVYDLTVDSHDHLIKGIGYTVHNTERLLSGLDFNHYQEKHKHSRPYPVTDRLFADTPLVGNVIGMGGKIADEEELKFAINAQALAGGTANMAGFEMNPEGGMHTMRNDLPGSPVENPMGPVYSKQGGVGGGTLQQYAVLPGSPIARMNYASQQVGDFLGLRGFMTQTVFEGMNDGMLPYEDIPKLESASWMTSPFRAYWDAELGDMLGCFIAGTRIHTKTGIQPIEDIAIGDEVFSDGKYRKVVGKVSYQNKATMSLKRCGSQEELVGTKQHSIPIYKRIDCSDNHARPCVPGTKKQCEVCSKKNTEIKLEDTHLEDISKGDFVVVPINSNSTDIQYIDMIGDVNTSRYAYYGKTSEQRAIAYELMQDNPDITRKELRDNHNIPDGIAKDTIRYRTVGKMPPRAPRYVELTNNLLYFIGWWLAEGCCSKNGRITLTMNKSEMDIAIRLNEILQDTFGFSGHIYTKNNTIKLRFSHIGFARYLSSTFSHGARNKKIPAEYKDLPPDRILPLLQGLIEGDGWINETRLQSGFTSVSQDLCTDTYHLALKMGYIGNINLNYIEKQTGLLPQGTLKSDITRSYIYWRKGSTVQMIKDFYGKKIDVTIRGDSRQFIHGDMLFCQVRSIRMHTMSSEVYDLSIEDKHYYTANDILVHNTNELIRRFIPKHGEKVNEVNPLPNMVPSWMRHSNDLKDFSTGDPFAKIKDGEARLPGAGYEALHSVRFNFPLEAEYMGRTFENSLAMMTGNYFPTTEDEKYEHILGGKISQRVQESLSMSNAMVEEGRTLFNPKLNLSGKIDLVINGVPTKTKVVSNDTFKRLNYATPEHHRSEMNTLLMMGAGPIGNIMYFNAESGETKSVRITPDRSKYYDDIQRIMEAKSVAQKMVDQYGPGIGVNMANAYSRMDRLKILADASPYSDEFQTTLRQVRTQSKMGTLDAREQAELQNVLDQREQVMQRYISTEYKFNRGTPITNEEKQYQERISDEYNVLERTVGSVWESFSHLNTPIHNKFLNVASSLEQYERNEVYGKYIRRWETPYQSFIRPYTTSMLSKDSPFSGALSFGTGGFIFGGPVGMAGGAVLGGIYGAANSALGLGQVPAYRQEERELTSKLDRIRFEKSRQVYETTGSLDARKEMMKTMTYQYTHASNVRGLFGSMPRHESAFIRQFAKVGTVEDRERIMEILPEYAQPVMDRTWAGTKWDPKEDQRLDFVHGSDYLPNEGWKGWSSNISTDDIAVKMFQRESLDAHNIGLGWQDQIRKMRYTPGIPDSFASPMEGGNVAGQIESIVQSIIPGASVSAIPTATPGVTISIS